MSLAADALQPFIVPGLTGLRGRPSGTTLTDLIGKQSKIGFDLDFDDQSQCIKTDFRDSAYVLDCIASDSSRFASAAFQSIKMVPKLLGDKEEIAWSAIKAYYAAFYAGQAVMRLFGESLSYFDRSHITRILNLAAAVQKAPNFSILAGGYHCSLNASARCISSSAVRRGTGGAH